MKSGTHKYSIYDANDSWSDGDISWSDFTKEGAIGFDNDEDDPISSVTLDKPSDKDPISFDVTGLVSKWVSGDITNNGFVISAPNTVGEYVPLGPDFLDHSDDVVAYFYSSEAEDGLRPTLVVEYDDSPIINGMLSSENAISIIGLKNQIKLDVPFDGESAVSIHNLQGQQLYSELVNSKNISIEAAFNAGIYFVTIENGAKKYTQRVVLQ